MTTPEERMADRLVDRHSLTPRVDIERVASIYATVRSIAFPVEVDGVSLNLKSPGKKPEILINSYQSSTRWRFTLAHELAHVVIPWHIGSIVDDTDVVGRKEQSQYWTREAEANRFAAEILMPSDWTREFIGTPKNMAERVARLAQVADVSVDAAVLRVLKLGPTGYIVAKAENKMVLWSNRTLGTRSNKPQSGATVTQDLVSPSTYYDLHESSTGTYHWWRQAETCALPNQPTQTGKEILQEIIDSIPVVDKVRAKQSVNGIISVANGQLRERRSKEAIYAACLHNIHNRSDSNPDIALIISHPRFVDFIVARSYEFRI